MLRFVKLTTLFGLLIGGAVYSPAHAYKVSPLVVELGPTGATSQETIEITNTHSFPLTLEISATQRGMSPDGQETEVPADEKFLIFPPQAIVPPGKTQKVRVKFVSDTPETSEAYRVSVEQIPVRRGNEDPTVSINFTFRTAVYVIPDGVNFNLQTTSVEREGDYYRVGIKNSGKRHAVLTTGEWIASSSTGTQKSFTGKSLGIEEAPLIMPDSERVFRFPVSVFQELGPLTSIEARPER